MLQYKIYQGGNEHASSHEAVEIIILILLYFMKQCPSLVLVDTVLNNLFIFQSRGSAPNPRA